LMVGRRSQLTATSSDLTLHLEKSPLLSHQPLPRAKG
jgi:hypothetical protein